MPEVLDAATTLLDAGSEVVESDKLCPPAVLDADIEVLAGAAVCKAAADDKVNEGSMNPFALHSDKRAA